MFSDNLKQKRIELGYSQKDLSSKSKIAERVYQSYEYGKVIPKLDAAVRLADALDCSLDWLTGREQQITIRKPFQELRKIAGLKD